jgi:hypothetical protein
MLCIKEREGTLPEEGTGSTGLVTQRDLWDRVKDITYDVNSDTTTVNRNLEVGMDLGRS